MAHTNPPADRWGASKGRGDGFALGRLARTAGRVFYSVKGLRGHACSLVRSPKKSFANACEAFKQVRRAS